jgi:hypothetical protein
MKSLTRSVAFLGLAVAAFPVFAQSRHHIQVQVPFAFTAGSTEFPAGSYIIDETTTGILSISSSNGPGSILVGAIPTGDPKRLGAPGLTFERHSGKATLAYVWAGDTSGWSLSHR